MPRGAALGVALLMAVVMGRASRGQGTRLPSSILSVRAPDGRWRPFWSADSAPIMWRGAPLDSVARWRVGARGLVWTELELKGSGEAWRTRLVVVRVDPTQVRLALDTAFTARREAAWTLAHAPPRAVLAVNAGQFEATMPWGWVVLDGRRWLPPQHGPLSAALRQDSSGALHWERGLDVQHAATEVGTGVAWAFQSYPAVLAHDSVLPPIRAGGQGVDVAHRDARAGICLTRDGHLLVALTRFDAAGRAFHFVPFGLTVPEMAAVLGGLGCRDAMLLDGGISARLRVRDARGTAHDWEGLRPVPLALVALPR